MAATDSDDEDIRVAIAVSLASDTRNTPSINATINAVSTVTHNASAENTTSQEPKPALGLAGLDRKAMEEQRLARLSRKRERSISPPPLRDSRKAPKLEANTISLPSGARLTTFSTLVDQGQQGRKSDNANAANQQLKSTLPSKTVEQEPRSPEPMMHSLSQQRTLQFPNGVVKKTWAFGFDRTCNDVKLEEVLEPRSLRTAVLSAFQFDVEWVLSKLKTPINGGSTKCVFVMQGETAEIRQKWLREAEHMKSFLRLCFPSMEGQINCMHSKLMLLFHPEKLRIAIPTANLLNFDWGETGKMENSVFMIDLPRLSDSRKTEVSELTDFGKEMTYFIAKQGLDEDVRTGILNFDFSATQNMRFVHTAGGPNYGELAERTGLVGLSRAVRQLGMQTEDNLEIDFAASSIGSLTDKFLQRVHGAARGEDMTGRSKETSSKARTDFFKRTSLKADGTGSSLKKRIRIYFPLHETVTSSIAGQTGTVCLSRKYYEKATFPKGCFRDYRSTRSGLLSHNKILYARGKKSQPDGTRKDIAWAYVGSANMSESAWGQIVYDEKHKTWKINCRNWECGVVMPVPAEQIARHRKLPKEVVKKESTEGEDSETESEDDESAINGSSATEALVGMEVFQDLVPPPFEIPGRKYEGRQPWYFLESA